MKLHLARERLVHGFFETYFKMEKVKEFPDADKIKTIEKKERRDRVNIGLIGVGSIGKFLLEKLNHENILSGYKITAVFDERNKSNERLEMLAQKYHFSVYHELENFLTSDIDIVVECANVEVVKKYARQIIKQKDLFLISVGALVDPVLYEDLQSIAKRKHRKIYLPSGAIGGLDVLRAAQVLGGLDAVKLVTRKPAEALTAGTIEEETIVFDGPAREAIKAYPKNANISIIISLSGIGIDKTRVQIIADPKVNKNLHQLKAHGDFGKLELKLENNPSPDNPKTSYLTALSILSSLKSLDSVITIGS